MIESMNKTILVIDDDKLIREGLAALLKNQGLNVLEATDGKEGLEMALAQKPDVVVTDVRMPKMTGLEMLEKLRDDEWGNGVPVIILTNDESNDSLNQALQSGVTLYFAKNVDPTLLTQQVMEFVAE